MNFPEVKYNHVKKCKLFNQCTMKYLSLENNAFIAVIDESNDTKADFELHFFHTQDEDRDETELVVPVHSGETCLVMNPDKGLTTGTKKKDKLKAAKKADNSFFYYKSPGGDPHHVVFEGMNGNSNDCNFYLAVNETDMKLELKKKEGDIFPRNMIFQIHTDADNEV